jgi:hypothetical protein
MSEPVTSDEVATSSSSGRPGSWVIQLVAVVVAYALVGLVAGFVWEAVWTPPTQQVQNHAVFYTDYQALRRVFTGTGLYALVAAAASAVTALVVCVLSRRREMLTLLAMLVGSALAAWVMWKTGVSRGPVDPTSLAAHAANGTKVSGPLQVSGHSPYLVWPMASLLVLALVFFGSPRLPSGAPRRTPDAGGHEPSDHSDAGVSDSSRG